MTPSAPAGAHPAIVHLFDWRFADVERALPDLARAGFDAVQVSPPQASIDQTDWWGRYQPVDHTRLEGPLGSEAEFRSMIAAAHRCDPPLKVVVDVVLNHMAERAPGGVELTYPRFGPEHFHPRAAIDWNSIESIRTGWIGYGPDLPDLRTELPYVRDEARRYLERLLDCGADGFRFDAVKHIEPEFFDVVLDGLPPDLLRYGEYIVQPGHGPVMASYLRTMRLMDFHGLQRLRHALSDEGDLAQWLADAPHGDAIAPQHAVSFVTNHDIELDQYGGFHLPADALALAHAATLSDPLAWPLVWHEHRDDPVVRAVLQLRRRAGGAPREPLLTRPRLLAWRCGDHGVMVLNAARDDVVLDAAADLGLAGRWTCAVDGGELPARWTVGARRPLIALAETR